MLKHAAIVGLAALGALVLPSADAQAQVIPINVGVLGPIDITQPLNFATGNEFYAFIGTLAGPISAAAGTGMMLDTIGSVADTEVAVYGAGGMGIMYCNDDGEEGPWGDPGLDSVLTHGTAAVGYGTGFGNGLTTTGASCVNTGDLAAGSYVWVVSVYSTTWGDPNATSTVPEAFRSSGASLVHAVIN